MQQNNPVFFIAAAAIGAIASVITTLSNSCLQNKRENKNWVKSELRNIYGGSIQSLATLLTLSSIESNMDSIEGFVVEAKKWLALSWIYFEPKQKEISKVFEEEIYLFTSGQ